MTDNNKKDPVGSIAISSDQQATKKTEKKKEKPLPPKDTRPSVAEKISVKEIKKQEEGRKPGPGRRKIPRKTSPLLVWVTVCAVICILSYTVGGFFIIPHLLRTTFSDSLSKRMDRPVTVGNAQFNPFTFHCSLSNVIIGPILSEPEDKVDPLFSIDNLQLTISPLSVFKKKLIANNVLIDQLFLHLVRTGDKSYNITNLIEKPESQASDDTKAAGLSLPFLLTNISASNSRIIFDDLPAKKTHTIEEITLSFPTFFYDRSDKGKSLPSLIGTDTLIQPEFSAVINGSPVALSGDTSVTDKGIEAQLRLQLDHIDIPNYLGYLPFQPGFTIEKGTATGQIELVFLSPTGAKPQLEIKAQGALDNLLLRDKNGSTSTLPLTEIKGSFLPLSGQYTFSDVKVANPEFQIKREKDNTWLFPVILQSSSKTKEETRSHILSIDVLQITDGKISFTDNRLSGGFSESLVDLNMTVKNLSSLPEKTSSYVLSAAASNKSKLVCQGNLSIAPLHMEGLLIVNQINVSKYSPYLSLKKGLHIQNGFIPKAETRFSLTLPANSKAQPDISFQQLSAGLSDFKLTHKKQEWLTFSKAKIVADAINPSAKIIHLKNLELDTPFILGSWNNKNISNWKQFQTATLSKDSKSWEFGIAETEIKNGTVRIEDHTWQKPFIQTLTNVSGKISGLSNQKKNSGKVILSASQKNKWSLNANGTISLSPFKANIKTQVTGFPLAKASSLFSNWLAPSVSSGLLQANGQLTLPQFVYNGSVEVSNFQAFSKKKKKTSLKKAVAEAVSFSRTPRELIVEAVKLEHPYLNWTTTPKDSAFHGNIFTPLTSESSSKVQPTHVKIGTLEVASGTLDIHDTRLSQPFRSSVTLSGTINDIESSNGKMAKVSLRGSGSSNDSITVLGYLGLLHKKFSCDITTEIANQHISAVAPQLEALLGYKIKTGSFDFLSRYQQKSQQVTGSQSIVLSDFSIGKATGKPGPLPLTVALLSDKNGTLKFDLPITGKANEKSYSYPKTVQRALQSLVLKSTVSPFNLALASFPELIGAPDHVLFTAGESSLNPENIQTLKNLQTILSNRPGLTVHIKGYAAAQEDKDALLQKKKKALDEKQKAFEQVRSTILSESYGKELIQPSPLPNQTPEPVPTKITPTVKDTELKILAKEREKSIRDYLANTLKIESDRITIDGSGIIIPVDAPGRKGSRVDFSLGAKK
jgi:uncharacterized protein involved in outer membrane biogenesis